MMSGSMMSDGMASTTLETNERISKAKPRKAPEGLDQTNADFGMNENACLCDTFVKWSD